MQAQFQPVVQQQEPIQANILHNQFIQQHPVPVPVQVQPNPVVQQLPQVNPAAQMNGQLVPPVQQPVRAPIPANPQVNPPPVDLGQIQQNINALMTFMEQTRTLADGLHNFQVIHSTAFRDQTTLSHPFSVREYNDQIKPWGRALEQIMSSPVVVNNEVLSRQVASLVESLKQRVVDLHQYERTNDWSFVDRHSASKASDPILAQFKDVLDKADAFAEKKSKGKHKSAAASASSTVAVAAPPYGLPWPAMQPVLFQQPPPQHPFPQQQFQNNVCFNCGGDDGHKARNCPFPAGFFGAGRGYSLQGSIGGRPIPAGRGGFFGGGRGRGAAAAGNYAWPVPGIAAAHPYGAGPHAAGAPGGGQPGGAAAPPGAQYGAQH
jgi:hypothetical protein